GGNTYTGPVRINQDAKNGDADQFQPWLAITDSGQLDVSYFDRRRDPNNFFIQTWLSRSNDGGKTWHDAPVGHLFWDPHLNDPISPSGLFIGDYQGLVADDDVAVPYWNDTQWANLPKSDPEYSPYQEVSAARIYNTVQKGGPSPAAEAPSQSVAGVRKASCLRSRLKVGSRGIGSRLRIGNTQKIMRRRAGPPTRAKRLSWRYCVGKGKRGSVVVAFSPELDARLILTTARGHSARGIHPGSTVKAMLRKYHDAKRVPKKVWFTSRSTRIVFGMRKGKITFVAVADRRLIKEPGLLEVYLQRAGV